MTTDLSDALSAQVQSHVQSREPIAIIGSGSKRALGLADTGTPLVLNAHRGIVTFEPTELVVTARAGTPIIEVEEALAAAKQMLPFEPPRLNGGGTIGGAIATGLSGPRRPYAGSARDFVLGTRVINGRGQVLRFGGEVMKNVAGYDVSRLMTGAMGTLGVLLDVSMKVLPAPAAEASRRLEMDANAALMWMDDILTKPYPISALAHLGDILYVRISGTEAGVRAAEQAVGGDPFDAANFWSELRDHSHMFFSDARSLWRIAVPPGTPTLPLDGTTFLDWGGTQRWLKTQASANVVRAQALAVGGHATRFDGSSEATFQALNPALVKLHQRLKDAFDPYRILNPGRLYANL